MSKRFQATLEITGHKIKFAVLEQPEEWRKSYGAVGSHVFHGLGGVVRSVAMPELVVGDASRKMTIYLRGYDKALDNKTNGGYVVSSAVHALDEAFSNASNLLREFADAAQYAAFAAGIPLAVEKRETLNRLEIIIKELDPIK